VKDGELDTAPAVTFVIFDSRHPLFTSYYTFHLPRKDGNMVACVKLESAASGRWTRAVRVRGECVNTRPAAAFSVIYPTLLYLIFHYYCVLLTGENQAVIHNNYAGFESWNYWPFQYTIHRIFYTRSCTCVHFCRQWIAYAPSKYNAESDKLQVDKQSLDID